MTGSISPLAPTRVPDLPTIDGVRLATAAAGIKYANRTDVLMVLLEPGTTTGGVLTRSKCPSAPVDWCRAKLKSGKARALIVNSGNANAFTGKSGRAATELTAKLAIRAIGCRENEVLLASTGVIGEPLQANKFAGVMDELVHNARADIWLSAAKAIMTTDTFPKVATASAKLGKATVTINGIAKGAGMIAPDMATMLAFLFTDAAIEPAALRACLNPAVDDSLNAITIDGDTSTSDTLLIFATGRAVTRGAPHIAYGEDPRLAGFRIAVAQVLHDLALQIVKDGEGLT
ncbi:MAG: bifunctional ornithine acetyltransferase/N-acetylglutamate synthase, partial [Xanthobacteraceae bacterium]